MRDRLLAATFGLVLCGAASAAGQNLGHVATPDEIAAWDISIGPDGSGLPAGSGTPRQGEAVFAAKCAACHGENGGGKPNDRLVGGQGTLAGDAPVKTIGSYWPYATTIFDCVRRAMPLNAPQSLNPDEVYAVSAYVLFLNGIVAQDATLDADTLAKIKMPNRGGFVSAFSPPGAAKP